MGRPTDGTLLDSSVLACQPFICAQVGLIMSGAVANPSNLFTQATEEEKAQVMLQNTIILDDLSIKQVKFK